MYQPKRASEASEGKINKCMQSRAHERIDDWLSNANDSKYRIHGTHVPVTDVMSSNVCEYNVAMLDVDSKYHRMTSTML
jgi:hypothetical protein